MPLLRLPPFIFDFPSPILLQVTSTKASSLRCWERGRPIKSGWSPEPDPGSSALPEKHMDILNQLGGLVLGSIPTVILFTLLYVAYQVLLGKPLERTLAERHARTAGAVEQARGAIAAAEAETAVFEEKLRVARAEILAEREQRLKQWHEQKDAALAEARSLAKDRVVAAKKEIEASAVVARQQIEQATEQLSEQIMRAVMPQGGGSLSEAR